MRNYWIAGDIIQGFRRYYGLTHLSERLVVRLQVQTARIEPDVTVVRLIGRLITRVEGHALEVFVHELLSRGEKKLIFDLCGIEEMAAALAGF